MADANGTIPNAAGSKGILLRDLNDGAPYVIPANVDANGNPAPVFGTGNMATTGDKQFVTAAQLAALAAGVGQEVLLATKDLVDLNTATPTSLYTVPAGKTAIITKIVVRKVSGNMTTASLSFGWTTAAFADVIAAATHTELTGNTLYTVLVPKAGALAGVAAATLKMLDTILQGGAMTCSVDVFGYTV